METNEHVLAVTLGDPCGLGPELVVRALADGAQRRRERGEKLLLIGPLMPLLHAMAGRRRFFETLRPDVPVAEQLAEKGPGAYLVQPDGLEGLDFPPGEAVPSGGLAAGRSLELAVRLARDGVFKALVTCPLNKAMLQEAGFHFPGHTEFLAEGLGVGRDNVTMHLCGPTPVRRGVPVLRVSLVTTHPALADVPRLVTREKILRSIRHTAEFLKKIGLEGADGAIGVCGLNPHAGESGRIGREEIETVGPAVEAAKKAGYNVEGPIPADTLFHFAAAGRYAAVVAMYHDQGLAPLKLLHFGEAVNVTLGLPIVRTSPDHGTGYDIVGTGKAKLTSFLAAVDLARKLSA